MSLINKSFVKLFKSLYDVDTTNTKFIKLASVYSKIDITETIVMKFYQDYEANKNDICKLKIFNNTPIETVVDKVDVNQMLVELFETCKTFLFNKEQHQCTDGCCHNKKTLNKKKNKLEKLLNNKQTRDRLRKELNITSTQQLDKLLQETIDSAKEHPDLNKLINPTQMKQIKGLFNNKMFKDVTKKLMDKETTEKLQKLVFEFMEKEDIKKEIENIKLLFNEQSFLDDVTTIIGKLKTIKSIDEAIALKDDEEIMSFIGVMEKHLANGLINTEKIETMIKKYSDEFMKQIEDLKIIDTKTMSSLNILTTMFGGSQTAEETKEDKVARRQRKQKEYRRKLRKKYKNSKK